MMNKCLTTQKMRTGLWCSLSLMSWCTDLFWITGYTWGGEGRPWILHWGWQSCRSHHNHFSILITCVFQAGCLANTDGWKGRSDEQVHHLYYWACYCVWFGRWKHFHQMPWHFTHRIAWGTRKARAYRGQSIAQPWPFCFDLDIDIVSIFHFAL